MTRRNHNAETPAASVSRSPRATRSQARRRRSNGDAVTVEVRSAKHSSNGRDADPATTDASPPKRASEPRRKIRVFLSHKGSDKEKAKTIRSELEAAGAGRLEVFVSSQMPFGADWRKEVEEKLKAADWLILLYTDSGRNWDWCLWECGYFAGLPRVREIGKVYVLKAAGEEGPAPLRCIQSYGASRETLTELVREMYTMPPCEGVLPINPALKGTAVEQHLVELLLEHVPDVPRTSAYLDELHITVPGGPGMLEFVAGGAFPPDTLFNGDGDALLVLGVNPRPLGWKWSQLQPALDQLPPERRIKVDQWLAQLAVPLRRALADAAFEPGLPMLQGPAGNPPQMYRPAIARLDRRANGTGDFTIVFVEVPPEVESWPRGQRLGSAMHLLMLARMTRFGAIRPLESALEVGAPATLKAEVRAFADRVNAVTVEAANRSITQRLDVLDAFEDGTESRATAGRLLAEWKASYDQLLAAGDAPDVSLDEVKRCAAEVRRVNGLFFHLFADRVAELVKRDIA